MKNRDQIDIIYFSLFRWNNPYSSVSFALGKEFALNNRVFYVNHPISYKDLLTGWNEKQVADVKGDLLKGNIRYDKVPGAPNNFTTITTPLTYPINWLGAGKMYDYFSSKNDQKIKAAIKQIIEKHNIKDYIFINCFDPFYVNIIPKEYPPILNIYQNIDDISQNDYTARHGVRLEKKLLQKVDMTLVTSRELRNISIKLSPHTYILHNAADVNIFENAVSQTYERPDEIKDIKTKIIGFTGNMDAVRVNYPLLKKIALEHTDKTLLLVGPINNTEYQEIGLDKLPNVIFTGSKNIKDLPRYLQYCDCVIIPFLCNKLTKSIYPLKINEYLAAGRSVISTDFSEDILTFKDTILIAKDETQFVQLVDKACGRNSDADVKARQAVANTNTWTARVQQFWEIIENYMQKHTPKKVLNKYVTEKNKSA